MTAAEQTGEGKSEFGRHGVVEKRVDGTVCVDGEAAAQQEPAARVAPPSERVVHDEHSVRQPECRERRHDDNQHLYDLSNHQYIHNSRSHQSLEPASEPKRPRDRPNCLFII